MMLLNVPLKGIPELRVFCREDFNKRYGKMYADKPFVLENIEIGDFSYCWGRFLIYNNPPLQKLKIGKFCSIADSVTFIIKGNHHTDYATTYTRFWMLESLKNEGERSTSRKSCGGGLGIVVGNDVWLGYNATLLEGVTIGDGACVGACSVVTKDVPPYAVAVGNPARVVKYRFSEEIIAKLLEMKWWNWTDAQLTECLPLLIDIDIDELYKFYKNSVKEKRDN